MSAVEELILPGVGDSWSGGYPVLSQTAIRSIVPEGLVYPMGNVRGVGEATLPNENHSYFCADNMAAFPLANGQGAFIIAADGVGKGRELSSKASTLVVERCRDFFTKLSRVPTLDEGVNFLLRILATAAQDIEVLQGLYSLDPRRAVDRERVKYMGTTVSIGITCLDEEGEKVLLTANRGDSEVRIIDVEKIERNIRRSGVDKPLPLFMQSCMQTVTEEEAEGNILTRSLRPHWIDEMFREGKGFTVTKLPKHAIILAMSDGWKKIVPSEQQELAIMQYYSACKKIGILDMQSFVEHFMLEAQAAWSQSESFPRDDIGVAAVEFFVKRPNLLGWFGRLRR